VIRGLREAVSRVAPDIIQTHAVKSHFLARWAGLTHINPWIAFHHGYTESGPAFGFTTNLTGGRLGRREE
jgi:hypothetical protein